MKALLEAMLLYKHQLLYDTYNFWFTHSEIEKLFYFIPLSTI